MGLKEIYQAIEYSDISRQSVTPYFTVAKKGQAAIVNWLQETLPILHALYYDHNQMMASNILWYMGDLTQSNGIVRIQGVRGGLSRVSKEALPFIVNRLWAITETRVSRLSGYKATFETSPNNQNEWSDKVEAKINQMVLERFRDKYKLDALITLAERTAAICSEAYIGIEHKKDIGITLKDKSMSGDVCPYLKLPWLLWHQPTMFRQNSNFLIEVHEILHKEEAKVKYGNIGIDPSPSQRVFSYDDAIQTKFEEDVVVYRIIHKPNEFLKEGAVVYIIGDKIVKKEDEYPWSHGDFPFVRLTDVDVPGKALPISFYSQLKPLQHRINKLSSLFDRNVTLCAHPKWLYSKGSVNKDSLANLANYVEHKQGEPPTLVTPTSISQDSFAFRQTVVQELDYLGGDTGVSRGTPPPGTRTAKQLAFFEEQEQKLASTQIKKHNEFIEQILTMAAVVYKDKLVPNKEFMTKVVGKEYEALLSYISDSKISNETVIKIRNSSAFAESKSARREEVAFMRKELPGLLTPQQEADILDLGQPERFFDKITTSIRVAQMENEEMSLGVTMKTLVSDDHLQHRKEHLDYIQSNRYRSLPEGIKEIINTHLLEHEMLMEEQAKKSPGYAQILMQIPDFPTFWVSSTSTAKTTPPQGLPMPPQEGEAPSQPPAQEVI